MSRRLAWQVAFTVITLLMFSACGTTSPMPTATPFATGAPTFPATLPTASTEEGPYFPIHNLGPDDSKPDALVHGRLQLIHGCIVLHAESGTTYLPLWPAGFRLAEDESAVLDTSGEAIPFGPPVTFGGGGLELKIQGATVARLLNGHLPPPECALDQIWLVTEDE